MKRHLILKKLFYGPVSAIDVIDAIPKVLGTYMQLNQRGSLSNVFTFCVIIAQLSRFSVNQKTTFALRQLTKKINQYSKENYKK